MCSQVLCGAEVLSTGGTSVSYFGVHGGHVPVQIGAVPEVLQTVNALQQLLFQVDGFLVAACVGLKREAGGAMGTRVASWHGHSHGGAVKRLVELQLRQRGLVVQTLDTCPVVGHLRDGVVVVLVISETLPAAKHLFAQRAGELL